MSLWRKLTSRKALAVIGLVNAGGTAFGFYYYRFQFANTSLLLWIFIPDCPLYTLLFIIWLFLINKKFNLFSLITATGLMKYGFWTVFVIALYRDYFLISNFPLYSTLFLLHIGMALESILILPSIEIKNWQIFTLLFWLLLNDYADYFLGTYPYIPASNLELIRNVTIGSTFAFTALALFLAKKLSYLRAY